MFTISGTHNTAFIYSSTPLEVAACGQVQVFVNDPSFAGVRIAIMPDAHAGVGCVVGFTAEISDKVVPNVVGVDQGCGVVAWKLGKRSDIGERYEKLDKFIHNNIPFGRATRDELFDEEGLARLYLHTFGKAEAPGWLERVREVADVTEQSADYVLRSLGTLGGGNHFIEVDKDEHDNLWLVIHSGSRNFGLKSCQWHQRLAEKKAFGFDEAAYEARVAEIKATKKGKGIEAAIAALRKELKKGGKKPTGLEYLEGAEAQQYYDHLHVAQMYAQLNRRIMGFQIIEDFFKLPCDELEVVESVHNYVNFEDRVLRKGAISAHAGELVIIPLNMADGVIIGVGRGNTDWNNSAPHGAGRKMSRIEAKHKIDLADYQRVMRDRKVWTSCVGKDTLDEAPQAYKKAETILQDIREAVDVTDRMRPTYNFKASE